MQQKDVEAAFITQNPVGREVNLADMLMYIGNQIGRVADALSRIADNMVDK